MVSTTCTATAATTQKTWIGVIILVFFLSLCTRVYWIHEKETLYGDELTSVCIAYDQPGWGNKNFASGQVYTGAELRQLFYIDERGGWKDLPHDLAVLHHDNRDASHASLYYMALRCALSAMDTPSMAQLIRYSCGLNLLFFSLSFLTLFFLLKRLFPRQYGLMAFCLLLAYMNPAVISNALFAREYQMAEWLFLLWAYWSVGMKERISQGLPLWTASTFCGGVLISCALVSCGYFNALFVCLTVLYLLACSLRRRTFRDMLFYVSLGIASLFCCYLIYNGFFNFLHDARMKEANATLQGINWKDNLYYTLESGIYIAVTRVLTPVWTVALTVFLSIRLAHKRSRQHQPPAHMPAVWLFVCALAWAAVSFWLAHWKFTRYITSAVPLCMTAVAYYSHTGLRSISKGWTFLLVAAFIGYAGWEHPIEHLERATERGEWPSQARRILLFAPDDWEKNTLTLMIPYIGDEQECVLVERLQDIRQQQNNKDSVLYVFGNKNIAEMRALEGFIEESNFNEWMSIYSFTAR